MSGKSAEWVASVDEELHLSDRRWRVFVCEDCDPRGDGLRGQEPRYEAPFVVVIEEDSDKPSDWTTLCSRCDSAYGMVESVLVTLAPVEGQR